MPILGMILLVLGVSLIAFGMAFNRPETVFMKNVQMTLMGNYDFTLHAEKNDWLEFDVNSSGSSFLYISPYGPDIHYGTRHVDSLRINETEDYNVRLGNVVSPTQMQEGITYSGYFRVEGQRVAVPVLLNFGVAFVVVAGIFLLIPVISPFLLRPNVLAATRYILISLRSLPRVASFFMLLMGTFLAAFGLFSLSFVRNDPFFNSGPTVNTTLFGSFLLAMGIILEMIRKKYSES
jgi:hypothetical protein